ncbi:MAG: nickel pincer cofactor biosynthesis protein LarC [Halanaerobiales bacterium]
MDAYFDLYSGISGNMVLGVLLDLGLDKNRFKEELKKLGLDDEYTLKIEQIQKQGIVGTYVKVNLHDNEHHSHQGKDHHHGPARGLEDIKKIIDSSSLATGVKEKSKKIFENLARAEAKVHGSSLEKIHFHEVGAVDAIVDIVGSVIGLELMEIKRIYASRVNTGTGFVNCQHGRIPVPAPATMELLQGVPVHATGIEQELVTPTGAAIITTLAEDFGYRPEMVVERTGYGAGSRELEIPNLLRVNLGRIQEKKSREYINRIETNIDDMNPEFYDYIQQKLFQAGALDVYLTSIQMKKNRPAIKLSVLCEKKYTDQLIEIVLTETSSLGIRIEKDIERICLDRRIVEVTTPWGEARVKLAYRGQELMNIAPEYEDCRNLAAKSNLPIKKIYSYIIDQHGIKL